MLWNREDVVKKYEYIMGNYDCVLHEGLRTEKRADNILKDLNLRQMSQFARHISGGIKADIESINLSDKLF